MIIILHIIGLLLPVVFLVYYFAVSIPAKKYSNFVLQNSIYLKELEEINKRYTFYPYVNLDQSHTYDNRNFFEDISCTDYLIYQLQYMGSKIRDGARKADSNKQLHEEYKKEIAALIPGRFQASTEKFNLVKLIKKEKEVANRNYQYPFILFTIKVTLFRSDMNGRVYAKKQETFYIDTIYALMKRINNRNGYFYNDKEIWNAICRVERGKVSNKIRFSIYRRDGYRCRCCGAPDSRTMLEIDHIIPIAKGGKSTYDNLQTLCRKCNYDKGDKLY